MKRSPQLENGFIRYAHELDAALAYADFTKGARIVLREVFAQIFGPAELKTAKISPTALANLYGLDKGNFARSIKELMDSGALAKIGECEYGFIKDYGKWTKNGRIRLSEKEMEQALKASERAMSYKQTSVVSSDNEHKPNQQKSVVSSDNNASSVQTTKASSIHTTDRCPSSQFIQPVVVSSDNGTEIERAHGFETAETKSSAAPHGDAPKKKPEYPDPDRYPLIIMTGPQPIPDSEARAIWDLLWHTWQDERLCNEFFEHQRFHESASWREAIRVTKRRGATPRTIRYLETIAADVDANGPKPDPRSSAVAATPAPVRASHRHLTTDPALLPRAKGKKPE